MSVIFLLFSMFIFYNFAHLRIDPDYSKQLIPLEDGTEFDTYQLERKSWKYAPFIFKFKI